MGSSPAVDASKAPRAESDVCCIYSRLEERKCSMAALKASMGDAVAMEM